MGSIKPSGAAAVMASRIEPPDSLDFFPTPPWATRALCEVVLPRLGLSLAGCLVWEPACGEGHMALTLAEYAAAVHLSDVHDYRAPGQLVGSFTGQGADVIPPIPGYFDWIITNPPFNLALEFAERALIEAPRVALLVRTAWLEGGDRYARLFEPKPPSIIAQFSERVPMTKGRWDPGASTATAYAWVIWHSGLPPTRFMWIPPGQRKALERPDDRDRFASKPAAPFAYQSEGGG